MEIDFQKIIKNFYDNDIDLWHPNTNLCVYIENHFSKILKYCFDNKTNHISYHKWLFLLNNSSTASKIGSETHNVCQALGFIDSAREYGQPNNDASIIYIPNNLIYEYYIKGEFDSSCWNIAQKLLLNFIKKKNILEIENKKNIGMLILILSFPLHYCLIILLKKKL